ncbi:MAG: hypothetical protein ACJA1A_002900 [Saprospiraceae bacterium]|jgi:hypothetical protein
MKYVLPFLFISLFSITINAQADWELQRDESGIKVWTKDYPDSKFKQFKTETTIKASLKNVVAVFLDVENMGLWYDRVERAEMVKKISNKEGIYIIDFELPWPVADRVSAVRSILSHDPTTDVVRIDTNYEPGVITNTDVLLITNIHSEWVLTPVEGGHVHIYHKGYMDPAGSLPAWISNSGVKDGPVNTLIALKGVLPNYSNVDIPFLQD